MTYRVLARKYRPHRFDELVGQDHIVQTLTKSLRNDRIAHAHIFSGPRGIGKTTTARLLAMAVNCDDPEDGYEPCNQCESCEKITSGNDVDVIEIDGASNNSVDRIRELRENARYAPARHERKVYIIDEVHMLSRSAFNALLKILEEPPDHVLFVFATTEVEQVPDTVLSRCQRYDFRLIPTPDIANALRDICEKESIDAEDEALFLIAKFAEGSLRDAQSILDQMISFAGAGDETLTEDLVSETWGIAPYDQLLSFLEAFQSEERSTSLKLLRDHLDAGKDLMALISDLAEMVRNCLLYGEEKSSDFLEEALPEETRSRLETISDGFTRTELTWLFDQLLDLHQSLKQHSRFQRELAEVEFVRLTEGRPRYNLSDITDRLEALDAQSSPSRSNDTELTSGQPETKPDPEPRASDPSNSKSNDSEPETTSESNDVTNSSELTTENWESFLESVKNPVRAFLKNARRAELNENELLVVYSVERKDHVKRLNQDKFGAILREGVKEFFGEDYDVEITMEESKRPTGEENEETAQSTSDSDSSQQEKFLRESKELLESES
jgi:DNA polymerase-3 subunit gamma/tau